MDHIHAFKTFDGKLFTSEKEAASYEDDKLGENIDELFRIFTSSDLKGYITMSDIHKAVLHVHTEKRAELKTACQSILQVLYSIESGKKLECEDQN